jgi:hypothetical protein
MHGSVETGEEQWWWLLPCLFPFRTVDGKYMVLTRSIKLVLSVTH